MGAPTPRCDTVALKVVAEWPYWRGMAPTLPPPAPDTEAQALRQAASEKRLQATRLLASAQDLEAAAARLEREARRPVES